MESPDKPYTREELARAEGTLPNRGPVCSKCGNHIPVFADFTDSDRQRIHSLVQAGKKAMAVLELRTATGCPLTWANLWVNHDGRPEAEGTAAACPYCGKPLKSERAQQCLSCNMDWHDPAHPRRLSHEQVT